MGYLPPKKENRKLDRKHQFFVKTFGDRKPMAVNDRSNQRSSYDNTLSAALEISIQNYFSRLRALHNFYPLDVARSNDASFSYARNAYGLLSLAPVQIRVCLVSLCMSTLKWHGTILVRTLAYSTHFFLVPLCTWVCVFFLFARRDNIIHVWFILCLL